MWAGGEALGEEEPKVLTGSLLGAAKASATRTRMPPPRGGEERSGRGACKKLLSDLSSSCMLLFIYLLSRSGPFLNNSRN